MNEQGTGLSGPDRLGDLLRASVGDGPAAPVDLVETTLARVRVERRPDPRLRLGGILAVAAALTVVVAASVGLTLMPGLPGPPGPGSPPAVPAPTSGPTTSPPSADFPAGVLGLPTISVERALEIRAASPASSEPLAVRGWYAAAPPLSCPYPGDVDALERACPDFAGFLMDVAQETVVVRPDGFEGRQPVGATLNPRFIGVALPAGRSWPDVRPLPVVLVGHWHDPRSMFCSAAARAGCRDAFVVDAVAWIDGEALGPQVAELWDGTPPRSTAADVIAAAERARPGATVLSLAVVGPPTASEADPRLLVVPGSDATNVWLVRLLDAGPAASSTSVYLRDGDPTVEPMPAWPEVPATAEAVDFPTEVEGLPVISVQTAIEDRAGRAPATDERMAVRGWYSPWYPVPCPPPPVPTSPLVEHCPYDMAALTALPEILLVESPQWSWHPPIGPSLNPRFIDIDQPTIGAGAAGAVPLPVVLVGHFHDASAASCPAEQRVACERAFVVDSIGWVGDGAAPTASPAP